LAGAECIKYEFAFERRAARELPVKLITFSDSLKFNKASIAAVSDSELWSARLLTHSLGNPPQRYHHQEENHHKARSITSRAPLIL
jgi:hypothetical protein